MRARYTSKIFSDEPMLFNPSAPPEWMAPFWLEDVRPRRAARLIEIDETDAWRVLQRVARGDGVMTTLDIVAPPIPRQLKSVRLIGAAPVTMYAARRRSDHRPEVQAVIDAISLIAPPRWPPSNGRDPAHHLSDSKVGVRKRTRFEAVTRRAGTRPLCAN